MSKYLSINEVAKLLGTSIHSIRYYEKEGLINQLPRTSKGYRLFSFKEIEQLSAMMLLRHCKIPIKSIKELFADYNTNTFIQYMNESAEVIENEIKKLQSIKNSIDEILEYSDLKDNGIMRKSFLSRYCVPIKTCTYNEDLTEREFYDFFMNSKEFYNKNYLGIICIMKKKQITYCVEIAEKNQSILIPKGEYLCYRFSATCEEDYEKEAKVLIDYIKKEKLKTRGELYLRELNIEQFFYESISNIMHEYQIRLI